MADALSGTDSERHARQLTQARAIELRRRTNFARAALAANALLQGSGVALSIHQIFLFAGGAEKVDPEAAKANLARFEMLDSLGWLFLFLGAVGFLRWLHRTMEIAVHLVSRPLEFTAGGAVTSFFIPIASLWRPYKAIRDLDTKIEPSEIPLPAARPAESFTAGYRDPAVDVPPQRPMTPRAPVALWWTAWLVPAIFSVATVIGSQALAWTLTSALVYRLTECAGAVLAVVVVTRIQKRLEERAARMVALT